LFFEQFWGRAVQRNVLDSKRVLDVFVFRIKLGGTNIRTVLINSYPAQQAASIVALAAFNVAWVSRAILPFAIRLRSLDFRVDVE
jgi:hypothetical protein